MVAEPSQSSLEEYYPRNIGLAKLGTSSTFAFLVTGKDEKGAQTTVLNAFFAHGAKIIFQTGYLDENYSEFTLCLSCDFKEADVSPDNLVIELRKFKFVVTAVCSTMKGRFFDRYLFPLTMMDSHRVVALDSDFVAELGNRLRRDEEGKSALYELSRSYALDVVKRIRAISGKKASSASIQENSVAYMRACGVGTFRLQSETAAEHVTIRDPPALSTDEASGNPILQGIAAGLVEGLKGKQVEVLKESYDSIARVLTITLTETPTEISQEVSSSSEESHAMAQVEVAPVVHVERRIRSNRNVSEDYESQFSSQVSNGDL